MHLTETGMPGYFQITAEGDNFKVAGPQINKGEISDTELLIENLAELLSEAIAFANNSDVVDELLADHGLLVDKGES